MASGWVGGGSGEWGGWSDLWSGLRFVFLSRTATALYFEIEFCLEILISSLCIVDLFSLVFSFCVFCLDVDGEKSYVLDFSRLCFFYGLLQVSCNATFSPIVYSCSK